MNRRYTISVLTLAKKELIRANRKTGYGSADDAFRDVLMTINALIDELTQEEDKELES